MIKHKIELTENIPVRSRPYPLPYAMRENLKEEIEDSDCDREEEKWIRPHLR